MKPLNTAFIGGAINSAVGYSHFCACRLDGYYNLEYGCFSEDEEQNKLTAERYGIATENLYSNWSDLISNESNNIEALVILTPTPTHHEIALEASRLGIPIICEKAISHSVSKSKSIKESIEKNSGYLAVTFNYTGYPMVRELRHMIKGGALGKIHQIHVEMPQEGFLRTGTDPQGWRKKDHQIPTVSLDLGTHVHHLIDFLTSGARPLRLTADQCHYGNITSVVDNVFGLIQYERNIRAQVWWGKTSLGHRNGLKIRVYGERGGAEWFQADPEVLRYADADGNISILDRSSPQISIANQPRYNRFKVGHPSGFIEAFGNLYQDIYFDLIRFNTHENNGFSSEYVFGADKAHEGMLFLEKLSQAALENSWIDF